MGFVSDGSGRGHPFKVKKKKNKKKVPLSVGLVLEKTAAPEKE